jgi:MYXO-CTERM domain-containing protein
MPVARFFVNLINEPPGVPGLDAPLDGSSTDAFELVAVVPSDPDLDEVYVVFTLVLMDGTILISDERLGTDGTVTWTPPIAPVEGEEMCWSATAVDEHGLEGATSDTACFTLDLTNLPPSAPAIEAPGINGIAPSLTPTIRVINGEDPEGRSTQHRFELDLDETFSSDALQQAIVDSDPTGTTTWTAELPFEEDALVYVRVLCTDGTNNSDWTTGQFLVSEANNPPSIPVLLDPQDGVAFGEDMMLVITNSTDPEGSDVRHDFKVLDLRDGLIAETSDIEQGDETTEWSPGVLDEGHYQWTARAIDEEGEESDWADTRSFVVGTPDQVEEPDLGGMVSNGKSNGCSCSSSSQSPGHLVWAIGLIGLIAQRRNRPRC